MAGSNLARFARTIVTADQALLRAAEIIREEVLELIDEGFRDAVDPIGRSWKPRKKFYPWPILQKTGAMRRGWYFRVTKRSVVFGNDQPYTKYHQDGTSKMVARKMVPDQKLSPKWRARIAKRLPEALAEHFGSK